MVLSNFRPIFNLPFIPKVLKKETSTQLQTYLVSNGLFETFQSGFRKLHSTESALLRVLNDILLSVDSGNLVVHLLLDLSAAYDTVDQCLEHYIGLKGCVLNWFK